MNGELEKARALIKSGRFAALLDSVPRSLADISSLDRTHRLFIAEAMIRTERCDEAERVVAGFELGSSSSSVRAHYEYVLAQIKRRRGQFSETIQHLQAAVRAAQEAADLALQAKCQLQLFRVLAEGWPGPELAAALAATRQVVTKAGEPHLIAMLHDSVALLEGQTGRREEARRHLDIAQSILDRFPNAWVEACVHTDAFCLAWLESEFELAQRHLEKARQASQAAIGRSSTPILDVNEAHLQLMTGDFASAFHTFDRLLTTTKSDSRIAAVDGLARLYFVLNRLGECAQLVEQNLKTRRHSDDYVFYPLRWSMLSAVRLRTALGDSAGAIELANREIAAAQTVVDVPLIIALQLLKADAECCGRQYDAAAATLRAAGELGVRSLREQNGHFYFVLGKVLAATQSGLAGTFIERAARVWSNERNVWALMLMTGSNAGPIPLRRFSQREASRLVQQYLGTLPKAQPDERGLDILNCVTAAFDLSYDPLLACQEIQKLADVLGCGGLLQLQYSRGTVEITSPRVGCATIAGSDRQGTAMVTARHGRTPAEALAIESILSLAKLVDELARFRRAEKNRAALWPADEFDRDTLAVSEEMTALRSTARKIAPANVPVLITGETGTGKEILARAIHAASSRAAAAFLPFNCSVAPRDMIDAQLFGHRRGAFTGAVEHAPGVIRAAAGGTLFLDEIGEAPLEIQPKLLRFLESGEIHPIGEAHPVKVDVRVIAATNVDLDAAVSTGRFREDLFYRLNIVRLHLPPLRERRVEIPVFAQHYLQKYAREQAKGELRLAEETMEYLLLYRWPGNVRQLANEMRRLAALAETDAVLMPEHLSTDIVASRRTVPASERTLDPHEVVVRLDQPLAAATEHLERAMLQYALRACGGRIEETARRLGLSRKGLYLKRVRFGLEPPEAQVRSA